MRHRRIAVLASSLALIGAAGAAGASYAAVTAIAEPNANGVITSCYNTTNGTVKMVNSTASCAAGTKKLTWASNRSPTVHHVGAGGEPAYQSGWKAYNGAPFGNLSYYKDSAGIVHLTGLACKQDTVTGFCTSATLIGGTVPIFTLPAGFRPSTSTQLLFSQPSNGEGDYYQARIDITTTGVVEIIAPPNAGEDWVSFEGISFLAE